MSCLGDSLFKEHPPPITLIAATQKWLHARFKGPFKELGDSLSHGIQADGISSLICSANTIAHGVFGDTLWSADYCSNTRVEWFSTLIQPRIVTVCALDVIVE